MTKQDKAQQQNDTEQKRKDDLVNFLRKLTAGEISYGMAQSLAAAFNAIDREPETVKFALLRLLLHPSLHIIPGTAKVTKVSVIFTETNKVTLGTTRIPVSLTTTAVILSVGYTDVARNKQGQVCLRLEDYPNNEDSADNNAVIVSVVPCDIQQRKEKNVATGIIDDELPEEEEIINENEAS